MPRTLEDIVKYFDLEQLTNPEKNPDVTWHGTRMLVRAVQVGQKTSGGVYLTEDQQMQKTRVNNLCEILAVGGEVTFFKKGDIVLLLQYSGRELYIPELEEKNLRVIDEGDVYCTIYRSEAWKENDAWEHADVLLESKGDPEDGLSE